MGSIPALKKQKKKRVDHKGKQPLGIFIFIFDDDDKAKRDNIDFDFFSLSDRTGQLKQVFDHQLL